AQFREKCHEKIFELQEQGKTMFVVSHNASQVQKLCERGVVLNKGKIVFDGPIDDAVEYVKPKKKK
ncbi:MAG: sugar ABC transporter ATP-binding protein, partial [Canibacter sp.]